jgi:hypothetical protein
LLAGKVSRFLPSCAGAMIDREMLWPWFWIVVLCYS